MRGRLSYLYLVTFLLGLAWILTIYHCKKNPMKEAPADLNVVQMENDGLANVKNVANEALPRKLRFTSPQVLPKPKAHKPRKTIHVSCVICGTRMEQAIVMLKSLVLFTKAKPHLNLFVENALMHKVYSQIEKWPADVKTTFEYTIYPVSYPPGLNQAEWKGSYWPCSTFRLFLPYLLPKLDASIYVDTDVIFFNPIEDLWEHFDDFSSVQLTAMAREHEHASIGWYNRFARHPYYPPLGLNSAVMLMNFTRMREFGWMKLSVKLFNEYKGKLPWTDQDIMNIIYHYNPEKVFVLPCNWNFRFVHCHYKDINKTRHIGLCPDAERKGAFLVHGNDRAFTKNKWPAIRAVYKTMEKYKFHSDLKTALLDPLLSLIENEAKGTPCWQKQDTITYNLKNIIEKEADS